MPTECNVDVALNLWRYSNTDYNMALVVKSRKYGHGTQLAGGKFALFLAFSKRGSWNNPRENSTHTSNYDKQGNWEPGQSLHPYTGLLCLSAALHMVQNITCWSQTPAILRHNGVGTGEANSLNSIFLLFSAEGREPRHYCSSIHLNKDKCAAFSCHLQNSLEGGLEGVLTGVEAVRVLILRNTACLRCLRWARELAASGVFFQ